MASAGQRCATAVNISPICSPICQSAWWKPRRARDFEHFDIAKTGEFAEFVAALGAGGGVVKLRSREDVVRVVANVAAVFDEDGAASGHGLG